MSDLKYKVGDYVKVVKTDKLEHLGSAGYVIWVNSKLQSVYEVDLNGESSYFKECELELVQEPIENASTKPIKSADTKQKVKSDGGSSSYYFSKLPGEVIDEIVETGGIELKDVVKYCFYNDADVKDITKAIKRIMENLRGGGKDGVEVDYDLNKIDFYVKEFKNFVLIQKDMQEN